MSPRTTHRPTDDDLELRGGGSVTEAAPTRVLRWEGCCNVRDLGGLPTEDGRATRFRVIVRGDDVSLLSRVGWEALGEYGVERIVDLRHEDPPYDAPMGVVRVPLIDDPAIREVDLLLADVEDPVDWRRENYLFLLDRFAESFGRVVSAVAAPASGTVLVHCAGGVDRTGLVAALVLRVAGVGMDAVVADYAESESSWAPSVGEWIDAAPDESERRKRRLLSVMPAEAMRGALCELERKHRSARQYLLDAGVDPAALDHLRERLVQ
jgi:protein-tyrosine phosphatase